MKTRTSIKLAGARATARRGVAGCVVIAFVCVGPALRAADLGPAPPVPPGYQLIEGDILVPLPPPGTIQPAGTFRPTATYYWPNGVVPYEFSGNTTAANQTAMLAAMQEWEDVANLDFVARSGQDDYLFIQDSTVNSSQVGRVGGQQTVNIYNWNRRFIMAHELGHALGFWHEQSRSDRDTYVIIETDNIEADKAYNFDRHDEASHYGPYDFDSVMHYDACSFSVCANCTSSDPDCRTITVRTPYDTQWQTGIGQRDHFSVWDRKIMSFLYPPSNWRFVDTTRSGTGSGTFLDPYKYFASGETGVPNHGTVLLIQPGIYAAAGTHSKSMTIRAPLGGAVLR